MIESYGVHVDMHFRTKERVQMEETDISPLKKHMFKKEGYFSISEMLLVSFYTVHGFF